MKTTAVFVEVMIAGLVLALALLAVIVTIDTYTNCAFMSQLTKVGDSHPRLMNSLNRWGEALVLFSLASLYVLGWCALAIGDLVYDRVPRLKNRRDKLFEKSRLPYERARLIVYQLASEMLLDQFWQNRHIRRLVRACVVFLPLLGLALLLQLSAVSVPVGITCLATAVVLYLYEKKIFSRHYRNMIEALDIVEATHPGAFGRLKAILATPTDGAKK